MAGKCVVHWCRALALLAGFAPVLAVPLLAVALVILLFGAVSRRAERSPLTPPIFFVAAGCLLSEHGLGLLHLDVTGGVVHGLAELALVVVLFTDASRIEADLGHRQRGRLLGCLARVEPGSAPEVP